MSNIGEVMAMPLLSADHRANRCFVASFAVTGASGAPDTTSSNYRVPNGVTITRTGTGTYNITFPGMPYGFVNAFIGLSAAGTVVDVVPSALSATAGTATLVTKNAAGTATDPASGDVVVMLFYGVTTGML